MVRLTPAESLTSDTSATDLIGSFKEDCELQGLSLGTIERYISAVRSLNRYLDERELDNLSTDNGILISFLDHLRREKHLRQDHSTQLRRHI